MLFQSAMITSMRSQSRRIKSPNATNRQTEGNYSYPDSSHFGLLVGKDCQYCDAQQQLSRLALSYEVIQLLRPLKRLSIANIKI
jgi:hypothetical protein